MCFSAPASFTASAGLLVIGAVAVAQAKTRPMRVLACIPLIFSAQQLSEGFLWLSFTNPGYAHLRTVFTYIFLAFAQVVWPVYVPFTIYGPERQPARRKAIGFLLGLGIVTALYLFYCLLFYPVAAYASGHHIGYELHFPLSNRWYTGITYLLATVLAPLLSGSKWLRILGLLLLASYIISQVLYSDYLVSVWCYFAAVLSIYVLFVIRQEQKG